jgi:DNA-binding MarR family transcriptional regulator
MGKMLVIEETLLKAFNLVNQEEKTPHDYGIGFSLYHSEMNVLETINRHEGANSSEIAGILGITTGAISQVTKKLIAKALVETYRRQDNQKEIYFRLTALGRKACRGHEKHHARFNKGVTAYLETLNDKEMQKLQEFFAVIIKELNVYIASKSDS